MVGKGALWLLRRSSAGAATGAVLFHRMRHRRMPASLSALEYHIEFLLDDNLVVNAPQGVACSIVTECICRTAVSANTQFKE